MALDPSELTPALTRIAKEVHDQCVHGLQSHAIEPHNACGQFYGKGAEERRQRGLHGTAAAMGILFATKEANNVSVAQHLLKYVKDREQIESIHGNRNLQQVQDDEQNTIKQSEVLLALNNLSNDQTYTTELKTKILTSKNATDGSWSFFLDERKPSDVATCHALLALHNRVTADVLTKTQQYLWLAQEGLAKQSESSDVTAIARRSLILYTLAVSSAEEKDNNDTSKKVALAVKSLWRKCRQQYDYPSEVTIEYYRNDANHFVRIPWQIYLAHALLLVDSSYYYSIRMQKYLASFEQVSQAGGFAYEGAGPYLSTRTNAILYRMLDFARGLQPTKSPSFQAVDHLSTLWLKPWVRLFTIFVLSSVCLYLGNKFNQTMNNQTPLLFELSGAALSTFFAWLYETGRR